MNTGVIDLMIQISTENENWANLELYNEVVKVVINLTSAEENAQAYAHKAAIPLLKAIERHTEVMFLQNAAAAMTSMSLYPVASKYLVKRGAVAVIIKSAIDNKDRKNLLVRYMRIISNFLYTESRTSDECFKTNAYSVFEELTQEDKEDKSVQKEWREFVTAYRMKTQRSSSFIGAKHYSIPIQDRLDRAYLRLLTGGTIVIKHKGRGTKPHKKIIRADETCTRLNKADTDKHAKQILMTAVKEIKSGNDHPWLRGIPNDKCFQIVASDPNGKDFYVCLETLTPEKKEGFPFFFYCVLIFETIFVTINCVTFLMQQIDCVLSRYMKKIIMK
ncbi:hypothetical protein RFI_07943 [Reticulomyxa filosa]|uniref:Uncharacterized protein n=1 Tax=Reticulomyxa filosa TaxID=46433 RepID=X6NSB7_RETFI|nr:hypothetical protein RFI_07943 [Reticulomyxa filosa]|eukprot:ETO29185.1 hypothetical protein RFI_07943 [Reticulomyxa filosa]